MGFFSFRTQALLSSCWFLAGTFLVLIGHLGIAISADDVNDRKVAAILQIAAWTMVGMSVLPEIFIDIAVQQRPWVHGRYGSRKNAILSWAQTLTFVGGAATQRMAMKRPWDSAPSWVEDINYFFQEKDYSLSWEVLFMISSVLFTVCGTLAVISTGCCWCGRSCGRTGEVCNNVQTSNILFLVAACCMLLAASTDSPSCNGCFHGFFLILIAYVLWIACAVMWILADFILPKDGGAEQEEHEEAGEEATPVAIAVPY